MLTHLKPEDMIEKELIYYEDINFDELEFVTVKPERQVLFHQNKQHVYKYFYPGYEFANNVEVAIDVGLYDKQLIPNFVALIKSRNDENRGFISERFRKEQVLDNIDSLFSFNSFKKIINKERNLRSYIFPKFKLNQIFLNRLLHTIFLRSIKTKLLFIAINTVHIWVDTDGYHLLDLESVRPFEWIFSEDKTDTEYLRKLHNKKSFNKNLKKVIELHGLIFPCEINSADDIPKFWESYVKQNKIKNMPNSVDIF